MVVMLSFERSNLISAMLEQLDDYMTGDPFKFPCLVSSPENPSIFTCSLLSNNAFTFVWIVIFHRKIFTFSINTFSNYLFISHTSNRYSTFFLQKLLKIAIRTGTIMYFPDSYYFRILKLTAAA